MQTIDSSNEIILSIIVPVYNGERYLAEMIDSVIGQLTSKIELILVNDGSQDNSLQLCQLYAARSKQVICLNKKNGGVSSARNMGIAAMRGNFFTFADQDDWFEKDAIGKLIQVITRSTADMFVYEPISSGNHNRKVLKLPVPAGLYRGEEMLERVIIPMMYGTLNRGDKGLNLGLWNCAFRKSLTDRHHICLDQSVRMGEDFMFISQYMGVCDSIELVDLPVYNWRINEESVSHTFVPKDWWLAVKKTKYIYNQMAAALEKWPREKWYKYYNQRLVSIVTSSAREQVRQLGLGVITTKEAKLRLDKVYSDVDIQKAIKHMDYSIELSARQKMEAVLISRENPALILNYVRLLLWLKKIKNNIKYYRKRK